MEAELVVAQGEGLELGEVADRGDDVVVEAVVAQVEGGECREFGDGDGNGSRELVPGEIQGRERSSGWPLGRDCALHGRVRDRELGQVAELAGDDAHAGGVHVSVLDVDGFEFGEAADPPPGHHRRAGDGEGLQSGRHAVRGRR